MYSIFFYFLVDDSHLAFFMANLILYGLWINLFVYVLLVCWGGGGARGGIVSDADLASSVSISFSFWLEVVDLAAFVLILIFVTVSFFLCVALCFVDVQAEVNTEALTDGLSMSSVSIPCSCAWHFVQAVIVVVILIWFFFLYLCAPSSLVCGDRVWVWWGAIFEVFVVIW